MRVPLRCTYSLDRGWEIPSNQTLRCGNGAAIFLDLWAMTNSNFTPVTGSHSKEIKCYESQNRTQFKETLIMLILCLKDRPWAQPSVT